MVPVIQCLCLIGRVIGRQCENNDAFFRQIPDFPRQEIGREKNGVSRVAPENSGCEAALSLSRNEIPDEETDTRLDCHLWSSR
jgi:hypothetical protein